MLGIGEYGGTQSNIAVSVRDPGPWIKVSVGVETTCGIKTDGSLWCWGDVGNTLASPGMNGSDVPIRIADPGPWNDISVSLTTASYSACGIKQDGTAWCWGTETNGNLGNGSVTDPQLVPTMVGDPGPWATISNNDDKTCGMKTDGSAWCWGSDVNGQLGNGTGYTGVQTYPTPVAGMPSLAPWTWEDTGSTNISAAGSANIALGTTGVLGYRATGTIYDCTGLGNASYNDPATGHCYYKVTSGLNWSSAQASCAANGAYLVTITSNSEQLKLANAFGMTEVWTSATDSSVEGSWMFTGGEVAGQIFWLGNQTTGSAQNGLYNNWNIGTEPNGGTSESCATTWWSGQPYWTDENCNSTINYICEKGTAAASGGLSFPSAGQSVLRQYEGGSELLLETSSTSTSSQLTLKAAAATAPTTRSVGIDYNTGALEFGNNNATVNNWMHAITPRMQITPNGMVSIGVTGATVYNKLQINGGLRIGNDTGSCNVARAGTLRYVGGSPPYQYCNGSAWVTF